MAKVKYYYDSDTLSYRKIDHKKGKKKPQENKQTKKIFLKGRTDGKKGY